MQTRAVQSSAAITSISQRYLCASSRPLLIITYGCLFCLLLCSCRAATASATPDAPNALPPRLVTVEVPVTVEVTRETVTERVVQTTPEPPSPCAPASLVDAEEVVVGVLLPLSQSSSVATTVAAQTGLVLAAAAINDAGGVMNTPIQLWWADTGNLPESGVRAAEEAIVQHCAVALIGGNNSETAAAIDQVAQRYGVPHIVMDATANELTASLSPTLFRLTPSIEMIATMHADWLDAVGDFNGDGVRSAAVIVENRPLTLALGETIAEALGKHEFSVDTYPVDSLSTDFSSLIARIVVKDMLPDAVLIRIHREAAVALARQLLENGVGPTRKSLLVTSRLFTEEDVPALGGDANLAWMVTPRVGAWSTEVGEQATALVDGYVRLFGRWPESSAFSGFDSLYLLADAMARAPSLAPEALVDALESTDIVLAGGRYRFLYGSRNPPAGDVPLWAWHQWIEQPQLFLQYNGNQPPALEVIWPPESATVAGPVMRPGE